MLLSEIEIGSVYQIILDPPSSGASVITWLAKESFGFTQPHERVDSKALGDKDQFMVVDLVNDRDNRAFSIFLAVLGKEKETMGWWTMNDFNKKYLNNWHKVL